MNIKGKISMQYFKELCYSSSFYFVQLYQTLNKGINQTRKDQRDYPAYQVFIVMIFGGVKLCTSVYTIVDTHITQLQGEQFNISVTIFMVKNSLWN